VLAGRPLALALLGVAALLLAFGCSLTQWTARWLRSDDPKPFVLDEVVGYLVAAAVFTFVWREPLPVAHAACFVLFRAMDVIKPYPASRLEDVPGAPGIMLDDVAAGVYAGALLCLLPYLGLPVA
jgi:phosphatidylglycerophosphatase A